MRYIIYLLFLSLLPLFGKMSDSEVSVAIGECILSNQYESCKAVANEREAELLSLEECGDEKRQRETFNIGCMQTGFLLFGAERYKKTIAYLQKGLEMGDDSYMPRYAYHRIGLSYQKLGDRKNATLYFDKACKEDYPFSCLELKRMQK